MDLNIKTLSYEDYDNILLGWWKDWNWTPPLRDFLPQEGEGGLMVWDNETPVCAGFVYTSNSRVAWIEWVISNKQYRTSDKRQEALKLLLKTLEEVVQNQGYKYIYALLKHPKLIHTYEDLGFVAGDVYNKEMIKIL